MFSGTVIDLDEAMGSNLGPNSSHATNNDSQATFPHPRLVLNTAVKKDIL
jgi:hypothetical protein